MKTLFIQPLMFIKEFLFAEKHNQKNYSQCKNKMERTQYTNR